MDEFWVRVDGARLFVRGWGTPSARPLLCWHGVGLTSRASLFMNEAGPLLADGYGLRVLALDAPGFGKSPPRDRRGYRPQALVDLIPPLLEALGLARVVFLGFSWGGDLGCHLAARHPRSLAGLVLLDAGYTDPPLDPSLTYEQRIERYERARREGGRPVPTVAPWVVAAVEDGMAHAPPSETRARLAESRLPVLLVAAGDAAEEDLARFAVDVPQAQIVRAEGTGHDVLTDGGPEVIDVVGGWLTSTSE